MYAFYFLVYMNLKILQEQALNGGNQSEIYSEFTINTPERC